MNEKSKNIVMWMLFGFFVLVIVIFLIIPLIVQMLQPTFYPETDISGFTNILNITGYVIGFLSAVLGVYSILQAQKSNKQVEQILNTVKDIQKQQEIDRAFIKMNFQHEYVDGSTVDKTEGSWSPDSDDE